VRLRLIGYGNVGLYTGRSTDGQTAAAAVRGESAFPVPGKEAIRTIDVLDGARTSALEGRVVQPGA
jgi:hypothetical protein